MRPEKFRIAMQRLETVLNERWVLERSDERTFEFPWAAGCIPLSCYAEINPANAGFIFRARHLSAVEPAQRPVVSEFIHRVNYDTPIGNWAIDLDDGDVRFKNGVYFRGGGELTEIMIRNVIDSALFFVYHDIMGVVKLQNGKSLEEAMAARGQDHGVGFTEGMKVPGRAPK